MNNWKKINDLYVNMGLKIFPVRPNEKLPMIKSWQNDCSCDYRQILYWHENAKGCNWGLPATPNNLFIIDCDVHDPNKNGVDNFYKLMADLHLVCDLFIQKTPSGGRHIIFQSDEELKTVANGSNVFEDYPGIDIRTDGYILVEPSSINNNQYKFQSGFSPTKMPLKLKQYILDNCGKKGKEKTPYEKPKEVYIGDRDEQLFAYINQLYFKTYLDEEEILLLANYFNENHFEEPLSEKDVTYKVRKAFEKNRGSRIILMLGDKYE